MQSQKQAYTPIICQTALVKLAFLSVAPAPKSHGVICMQIHGGLTTVYSIPHGSVAIFTPA